MTKQTGDDLNSGIEYRISEYGGLAQLGEHLPCKQGVSGSIPLTSTIYLSHVLWSPPAILGSSDTQNGRM